MPAWTLVASKNSALNTHLALLCCCGSTVRRRLAIVATTGGQERLATPLPMCAHMRLVDAGSVLAIGEYWVSSTAPCAATAEWALFHHLRPPAPISGPRPPISGACARDYCSPATRGFAHFSGQHVPIHCPYMELCQLRCAVINCSHTAFAEYQCARASLG
jgi:hypothetical protein